MTTLKRIEVDVNKCTGCFACELACAAAHAQPAYSSANPARSRIRVTVDEANDVYLPVRAANHTRVECQGRNTYRIDGKEYPECSLCAAVCPSRGHFTEPDSGLPLKCDMCESLSLEEPMCVQVCHPGALTYHEWEVSTDGLEEPGLEEGMETLVDRFGVENLRRVLARLSNR